MSLLEVKALNSHYGDSHILFDVDMRVERNEVVALIGRNGAGKTTTLKSVMGVLRPSAGSVMFDGVELVGLTEPRDRKARHAARSRGAAHLRQLERRGKSGSRRVDGAEPVAARPSLRHVSAAEGTSWQPRDRPLGRRAADARNRARTGARPEDRAPRRTLRRPGASHRPRSRRAPAARWRRTDGPLCWSSRTWRRPWRWLSASTSSTMATSSMKVRPTN